MKDIILTFDCNNCGNLIFNTDEKQPKFQYSENPKRSGVFAPICPKCGKEMDREFV